MPSSNAIACTFGLQSLEAALQLAAPLVAEIQDLDREIAILRDRKALSDGQLAGLRAELQQLHVEEVTLQAELEGVASPSTRLGGDGVGSASG